MITVSENKYEKCAQMCTGTNFKTYTYRRFKIQIMVCGRYYRQNIDGFNVDIFAALCN